MTHSSVQSFPNGAQVGFPLSRPMHLAALGQELLLLGYVIDQATRHWEAVWHTKGTGPIGALTTILKAHDRRVRLLGLHNPVPAAQPVQPATVQNPAAPPTPAPEPVPQAETAVQPHLNKPAAPPQTVNESAQTPVASPTEETPPEPLPPALPSTAHGPKPPPTPVAPLRLLPLDAPPPPPPATGPPARQRDFRQPAHNPPEWDYWIT